jgi:hypothetical protein
MNFGVWIPNCRRGPASAHAGRVLAADGRELEEQLTTYAERVRPQLR